MMMMRSLTHISRPKKRPDDIDSSCDEQREKGVRAREKAQVTTCERSIMNRVTNDHRLLHIRP